MYRSWDWNKGGLESNTIKFWCFCFEKIVIRGEDIEIVIKEIIIDNKRKVVHQIAALASIVKESKLIVDLEIK